jgi:zinc protease
MHPSSACIDPRHRLKTKERVAAAFLPVFLIAAVSLRAQEKHPQRRNVFGNGLAVVSQMDDASSITVLEILIGGGTKAEPAGFKGLSYLTTRLALEIPDQSKAQALMERAARYMMTAKGDYSVIHIECLSDYLDDTLEVFVSILRDPLFSSIRIDRVKEYMNSQRKIESDDNLNIGHLAHLRTFLDHLGYAGSIYGEAASLEKIKGRDIQSYYGKHFIPANMSLIVISDLESEKLNAILLKHFGSFPSGEKKAAPSEIQTRSPSLSDSAGGEMVVERETTQALVSLGFALPGISAKNYVLATFLEALIGKGPGSRLWPIRTEKRLAYNVNARATFMRDGGVFEAYMETDATKKDAARDALKAVIREIWEKGISADEFEEVKTFVRADFLRANETKDRRAETLSLFEACGLSYEYFQKFFEELAALKLDEVNSYIRDVLNPDKAALVLVGPKSISR